MEEEFFPELKSLLATMLDNIRPRRVLLSPSVYQQLIIYAAAFAVLLIAISLAARLFSYARHKKLNRERIAEFEELLLDMERVLGCGAAEGRPASESADVGLVRRCAELGERIDRHTNRKDCSKLVALLAYRIACCTKMSREQAAICFCCALVADAGLLDMPRQLFFREILSSKERKLIKRSIQRFTDYLDFIPACYMEFFIGASLHRRENFDGSGYPDGLVGSGIPPLARIIRVAEDFTSMTERFAHRFSIPLPPRAAVTVMKRMKGVYDQRIIKIMEKIVLTPE
jgi:HD-GYP domain-containing protein (c-di-GMP phosphodiesterase class II)